MFRDFSFEPASRLSSYEADRAAMNVSPTHILSRPPIPPRLPTPPPCSVGDLTQALGQQNLRLVVEPSFKSSAAEPLTPPSDDLTFPAHLLERPPPLSTIRLGSATLRMQRQANVRMQSSSSHIKDISSLVEKMVQAEDQCNVCERKPCTPPSSTQSDDDEGVDMDYTPGDSQEELRLMLSSYKVGHRGESCARVSKAVRMRRSRTSSKASSRKSSST